MKTKESRFQVHDELTAPEGSVPILKGALAGAGWLLVGAVSHSYWPLVFALMAANAMLVFISTVTAALIVEAGKRLGSESQLVTARIFTESACGVVAGPIAGYLATLPFGWTAIAGALIAMTVVPDHAERSRQSGSAGSVWSRHTETSNVQTPFAIPSASQGSPSRQRRSFARWGGAGKFKLTPDYTHAAGSAVGVVLQLAIEKAGSLDHDKVRAVLAGTKFATFYGPIAFNAAGQATSYVPPVVQITANYLGGNAVDLEKTVAQPIEEQLVGLDGMLYYLSTNANNGTMTINVTFKLGTNPDIAAVQTQNRVNVALPRMQSSSSRS